MEESLFILGRVIKGFFQAKMWMSSIFLRFVNGYGMDFSRKEVQFYAQGFVFRMNGDNQEIFCCLRKRPCTWVKLLFLDLLAKWFAILFRIFRGRLSVFGESMKNSSNDNLKFNEFVIKYKLKISTSIPRKLISISKWRQAKNSKNKILHMSVQQNFKLN
jgi:hypothetical protein